MRMTTPIDLPNDTLDSTLVFMPITTSTITPVTRHDDLPNYLRCLIRLRPLYLTRLLTQIYLRSAPRGIRQVVQESC